MSSVTCSWVTKDVNGPIPAPRQGHAATVIDKRVYVFGGSSGSGYGGQHSDSTSDPVYLSDLFLLKVGPQATWERLRQLGDIPSGRDGHTLSAVGSVLYLFGGSNYPESQENLEGLYAYDIGTLSWELCPTQGHQPRALGHTAAVVGDTLYVFGGIYHGKASNDLHLLNTGNLTWTLLKTSGQAPVARCDHACTVIGEKFYIMGGCGGERLWFNDLHSFDTVTLRWEETNVLGNRPHSRSLHTICSHHNKDIYLFGGSNDWAKVPSPFSDLYKFSLSKSKWKKLQCGGNGPEKRLGHSAVLIHGQLIIFGGMNDQKDFNDVCILQTRAALKHLTQDMADNGTLSSSQSSDVPLPHITYDLSIPVPAPYRPILPAVVEPVKPTDFEDVKYSFVERVNNLFEDLSAKYAELETQREALRKAVEAFHEEKAAHIEQYEKQQKELKEMLDDHKIQNEEWIRARQDELREERYQLELQKSQLSNDRQRLRQEQQDFYGKLEAIGRIDAEENQQMTG